jgi:TRAP-type mannitol/chloroaromatic compound transport system substrate-binding protein
LSRPTVFLFLGVGEWCTPSANAADVKTMRVQAAAPNTSLSYKSTARFGEAVKTMSGGRLDIQALPAGAIVETKRIPDAVKTGLVEAGATYLQYFAGKHMAGALFGAPPAGGGSDVGIDQFAHMAWLILGPGRELLNEYFTDIIKMNVVCFPLGFNGPAGQRGVIDGAQWGSPYDDMPMGFQQIWKHYYLQGAHFPISSWALVINKDFWNKLTPEFQKMIEISAQSTCLTTLFSMIKANGVLLKEAKEKHGVKVHDVPPDIFEAYTKAVNEVLEKYKSDPFFKKVLDSQREYADLIRPWWTAALKSSVFLMEVGAKK